MRRSRQGRFNALTTLLLLALGLGGGVAYVFGPYWIDYLNMKEVAQSAALQWYATGVERAGHERLRQGLRTKELDYLDPDVCQLEKKGEIIEVWCYWEVDVFYPFTDYYKTLTFEVVTEVDGRGVVHQY